MRPLLVVLFATIATSCAPATRAIAPVVPALTLSLRPAFVFAGGSVWVRCYVPASYGAGRIRFGILDVRTSEGPLESIEHLLLVERVPCGAYRAICDIRTADSLTARSLDFETLGCS
jgi:hypothetical protein